MKNHINFKNARTHHRSEGDESENEQINKKLCLLLNTQVVRRESQVVLHFLLRPAPRNQSWWGDATGVTSGRSLCVCVCVCACVGVWSSWCWGLTTLHLKKKKEKKVISLRDVFNLRQASGCVCVCRRVITADCWMWWRGERYNHVSSR